MASATEKRKYIADFSKQFGRPESAIKELPNRDNHGPLLDKWLAPYSSWKPGLPWCAAFVSSMAGYTDNKLGGSSRKYNSVSSLHTAAGLYSRNVKDAQIGLAISWKNTNASGGHVGIVVEVHSDGIVVSEGNTNNREIQDRNGGSTAVKKYSWSKAEKPAPSRVFNGYYKIWDEPNTSIGNPSNLPSSINVAAVNNNEGNLQNFNNSGYIGGSSSPPGKSYSDFFNEINGGISTNEKISELPKNENSTNNGNEKNNDFAEVKTIVEPTAKLDVMSLNKELEEET